MYDVTLFSLFFFNSSQITKYLPKPKVLVAVLEKSLRYSLLSGILIVFDHQDYYFFFCWNVNTDGVRHYCGLKVRVLFPMQCNIACRICKRAKKSIYSLLHRSRRLGESWNALECQHYSYISLSTEYLLLREKEWHVEKPCAWVNLIIVFQRKCYNFPM